MGDGLTVRSLPPMGWGTAAPQEPAQGLGCLGR